MDAVKSNNSEYRRTVGDLLPRLRLPASIAEIPVTAVTADSRSAQPGALFVALPGANHDGCEFIEDAVARGAVAVVCEASIAEPEVALSWRADVPVLGIARARKELSSLAGRFYGEPSKSINLLGVTGTNGKSTCVALAAQLQHQLGRRSAAIGTLGYGFTGEVQASTGLTTPDAVASQAILRELVDQQAEFVAMEVSSHALEQQRVAGLQIDTAIFTNLTRDHLDYHGDMESYARAKSRLFTMDSVRHAIINIDDELGAGHMTAALRPGAELVTYGVDNPAADVHASRLNFHSEGLAAVVRSPWGSGELHSPLMGLFNLYNLLAVVAAACAQGAAFERVLSLVPHLQPVKGRMQRIAMEADVKAIVDYAHTPDALRQALSALRAHGQGRVHVVFGCGGDRDKGKRPRMAAIAESLADQVYVTSDNPRTEAAAAIIGDVCAGFVRRDAVTVIEDRAAAITQAISSAHAGDLVLIAGKGHEDYQIIGSQRLYFDDATCAQNALHQRKQEENH